MNRRNRTDVLVLVAAIVLALGSRAAAQGTSGSLPGPIDSRQLDRYAEQLQLSEQQRRAMRALHDEYRTDFRVLREGDIAVFLQEQGSMQGGIPKREAAERVIQRLERIHVTIRALDDGFFDRLAPILTSEQQQRLPRLRLARERARYATQQTAARFGRRSGDLDDALHDAGLDAESFAIADAIIAGSERRITSKMRKLSRTSLRTSLSIIEALEDRGYVDLSQEELMADPELLQQLLGDLQAVYTELNAEVAALSVDIRELNARTCRQVMSALPGVPARRFRNAYYRQGYTELGSLVGLSERDWLTRALALDEIEPAQREEIATAAARYQDGLDQLLADGVRRVDAFWDDFSPFRLDTEGSERFREDLGSLVKQGESRREAATADLVAALGEDVVDDIRRSVAQLPAPRPARTAPASPFAGRGDGDEGTDPDDGDRFLPARISLAHIEGYALTLGLDAPRREVLMTLHADYLERLRESPVLARLAEAKRALGEPDPETNASSVERIERVYSLRRSAIADVEASEDILFTELASIVPAETKHLVARLRRARLRQSLAGSTGDRFSFGRDRSLEASGDLPGVVRRSLDEPDREAVAPILADYDEQAIAAYRERLDAQIELQQHNDIWGVEIQAAARKDLTEVVSLQQRYREMMKSLNRRARAGGEAIAQLNRRTLERIGAELGSEALATIRLEYDRAAFPSVFTDPTAVHSQLARAVELTDLEPGERTLLVELSLSYRPRYEELSRAMIERIGPGAVNVVGLTPDDFREWQAHQQSVAKLRFDRNELNASVIERLRALLTADQIRRIGGLPEPEGEEDFFLFR